MADRLVRSTIEKPKRPRTMHMSEPRLSVDEQIRIYWFVKQTVIDAAAYGYEEDGILTPLHKIDYTVAQLFHRTCLEVIEDYLQRPSRTVGSEKESVKVTEYSNFEDLLGDDLEVDCKEQKRKRSFPIWVDRTATKAPARDDVVESIRRRPFEPMLPQDFPGDTTDENYPPDESDSEEEVSL
jgi:hypothetical protein